MVSYRPSHVAPALMEVLDYYLVTRLSLQGEIKALMPFLAKHAGGAAALSQLPALPVGQAYLYVSDTRQPATSTFVKFHVGARTVPHVRHLRKYLRAPLPESKRFYFHDVSGCYLGHTAANLCEFREALSELPIDALQYHLRRGDFERWLRDVLRDDELARRVHKIGSRAGKGRGETLRQALLEVVIDRYEELDNLVCRVSLSIMGNLAHSCAFHSTPGPRGMETSATLWGRELIALGQNVEDR